MQSESALGNTEPIVDTSSDFIVDADGSEASCEILELNPHRLGQRQKQIDYGKNTPGYESYITKVPRERRQASHPQTPDVRQAVSKRGFDYQVKKWRRRLHGWDPKAARGQESVNDALSSQGSLGFKTPQSMRPTPERRGSWAKAAPSHTPAAQSCHKPIVSPAPLGAWSGGKSSPVFQSIQKPSPASLQVAQGSLTGGKENAVQSLKRPQAAFSPQGRPETKRPSRASWADEIVDPPPQDIYGDWDMEDMDEAVPASMSVKLEA